MGTLYTDIEGGTTTISDETFKKIVSFSEVGIALVDTEGKPFFANRVFLNIVGYSQEELAKTPFTEFTHPEDLDSDLALYRELMTGKRDKYTLEKRYIRKNKEIVWVLLTVSLIKDEAGNYLHTLALVSDITERKKAEFELRTQKSLLIETQKLSHVGSWMYDPLTQMTYWSDELYHIHGLPLDRRSTLIKEKIAKSIECYRPEDRPKVLAEFERALNKGVAYDSIYPFTGYDGTRKWIRTISKPVIRNDEVVQLMGSFMDITRQKTDEARMKEKNRQLKEEIEKRHEQERIMLQQSRLAAMGEMIGMIAHQWRQPLSVISAVAADLEIKRALGSLEQDFLKSSLAKINNTAQFLSKTINDFRDFFNPNKKNEEILPDELVMRAVQLIENGLRSDGITLSHTKGSETPILTYPNEIVQVILNIIKNAQDALRENENEEPKITIRTVENEEETNIEIWNNGGEIPEEIQDKVFEPYFSTKPVQIGTGLGLYMSKIIIEKHCHGALYFDNQENGVRFTIRLPKEMPYELE